MKKKKGGVFSNISNKLAYTLIVILSLTLLGIGVYANTVGTAPNPGHLLSTLSPDSPCSSGQVISWNGANLVCTEGWSPTSVTSTSSTHNGNFGSYAAMNTWIQSNGCSGYHVCDSQELLHYGQSGGTVPTDAWYNTGHDGAIGTAAYVYDDCHGWTTAVNTIYGSYYWLDTTIKPFHTNCNTALHVACCK